MPAVGDRCWCYYLPDAFETPCRGARRPSACAFGPSLVCSCLCAHGWSGQPLVHIAPCTDADEALPTRSSGQDQQRGRQGPTGGRGPGLLGYRGEPNVQAGWLLCAMHLTTVTGLAGGRISLRSLAIAVAPKLSEVAARTGGPCVVGRGSWAAPTLALPVTRAEHLVGHG